MATRQENIADAVAVYKGLLRGVLEARPSGTRQRLADALGKNRSFISQLSNPAYATPIPAPHLDEIFRTCHFSNQEKRAFLRAYDRAHPNKRDVANAGPSMRPYTIHLPDLGDPVRNGRLNKLVEKFVHDVLTVADNPINKPKQERHSP